MVVAVRTAIFAGEACAEVAGRRHDRFGVCRNGVFCEEYEEYSKQMRGVCVRALLLSK